MIAKRYFMVNIPRAELKGGVKGRDRVREEVDTRLEQRTNK